MSCKQNEIVEEAEFECKLEVQSKEPPIVCHILRLHCAYCLKQITKGTLGDHVRIHHKTGEKS